MKKLGTLLILGFALGFVGLTGCPRDDAPPVIVEPDDDPPAPVN